MVGVAFFIPDLFIKVTLWVVLGKGLVETFGNAKIWSLVTSSLVTTDDDTAFLFNKS